MHYPIAIGIDLGTSELKAILLTAEGSIVGHCGVALTTSRPKPGWSEQEPEQWWSACLQALQQLRRGFPEAYQRVCCVGLSGQMHGAVAIDASGKSLRPAILWHDSRADDECATLASAVPRAAEIVGSIPMAGLTAPKLLWLKSNEPQAFESIDCVLSPKDYLRLKLTGERITDMSDAAGTLWLDVRKRCWYEPMIYASGLQLRQLPQLVEGDCVAGKLNAAVAANLGLADGLIVAGGGGDNPASAIGIGAVSPGDAFITLGTSAAVICVTEKVVSSAATAVHGYCHALPGRWYAMGAILSGASCLSWGTQVLSLPDEQTLLDLIAKKVPVQDPLPRDAPLFLPYLSGERTPHNDAKIRASFLNLHHGTGAAQLGYSILEGVGFALRDAMNAIDSAGAVFSHFSLVGGGSRSDYWAQLLASILGHDIKTLSGSEFAACIGAAKLGFMASKNGVVDLPLGLPTKRAFAPLSNQRDVLDMRYEAFRLALPAVQIIRRSRMTAALDG